MDKDRRIIRNGSIAIEDDRIVGVGKTEELRKKYTAERVIDASGKVVLPGLINVHTHAFGTIFRGMCEDSYSALHDIGFPMGDLIAQDEECLRALGMLGCLQWVKFGSTCIAENTMGVENAAQAVEKIGLRGILSDLVSEANLSKIRNGVYEYMPEQGERRLKEGIRFIEKWQGKANGRITCILGPHAPDICTPELLEQVRAAADKYKTRITIHVGQHLVETRQINKRYHKTPVGYLQDTGILGPGTIAAHCVYLTNEDIKILRETDTKIAHCPRWLAKLGITAPLISWLQNGLTVGLGTDDGFFADMFEQMRCAIIAARIRTAQDISPSPLKVLEMSTIDAAKVVGLEKDIGSLEPDKKADIILVNIRKPHLIPMLNTIPNLVHNVNGNDVEISIINGEVVMEDGIVRTINEEAVLAQAQEVSDRLWSKFEQLYGKEGLVKNNRRLP